jgi:bifunctional UDP-N-acetylglucosamine pyrophosphorylase/glucosamine-1-phosphate N-acetyltransferase
MKAVILAAGAGTRLKDFTNDQPKVMIKIFGKPMLQYLIETLAKKGIKDLVIVVSYKKEVIMNYFLDGKKFGVSIEFVVQQNCRGGTADALRCVREKIKDEKFLLIYGDNVFDPDVIDEMIKVCKNCDGVVCGKEVENPAIYGVLKLDGNSLVKIIEKPKAPPSNLVLGGIFIMPKKIFSAIDETKLSPRGEYELTDSIQILIKRGMKFNCVKIVGFWKDIGTVKELEQAKEYMVSKL